AEPRPQQERDEEPDGAGTADADRLHDTERAGADPAQPGEPRRHGDDERARDDRDRGGQAGGEGRRGARSAGPRGPDEDPAAEGGEQHPDAGADPGPDGGLDRGDAGDLAGARAREPQPGQPGGPP